MCGVSFSTGVMIRIFSFLSIGNILSLGTLVLYFCALGVLWFKCGMSRIGSWFLTLVLQLLVLFREVRETLGGSALREEVFRWRSLEVGSEGF